MLLLIPFFNIDLVAFNQILITNVTVILSFRMS